MRQGIAPVVFCFLAACSGPPGGPAGWSAQGTGWTNPADRGQRFAVLNRSTLSVSSLSELASAVTSDVILRNKNAKYLSADVFPACPGAAGIQHFNDGGQRIDVAFALIGGQAVEAEYRGPRSAPLPDAVKSAMARAVCRV